MDEGHVVVVLLFTGVDDGLVLVVALDVDDTGGVVLFFIHHKFGKCSAATAKAIISLSLLF